MKAYILYSADKQYWYNGYGDCIVYFEKEDAEQDLWKLEDLNMIPEDYYSVTEIELKI